MVKIRYLIEIESEKSDAKSMEPYFKQLEKTFSYGRVDYYTKVLSEEKTLITQKEHERKVKQLLEQQESDLYKKFISVVDKFCYSEDDVKKMDKLLRETFEK